MPGWHGSLSGGVVEVGVGVAVGVGLAVGVEAAVGVEERLADATGLGEPRDSPEAVGARRMLSPCWVPLFELGASAGWGLAVPDAAAAGLATAGATFANPSAKLAAARTDNATTARSAPTLPMSAG
ncbi:MAG: hypothetical protein WA724_06350 [Candidatus Dormiibacterota bacterium]